MRRKAPVRLDSEARHELIGDGESEMTELSPSDDESESGIIERQPEARPSLLASAESKARVATDKYKELLEASASTRQTRHISGARENLRQKAEACWRIVIELGGSLSADASRLLFNANSDLHESGTVSDRDPPDGADEPPPLETTDYTYNTAESNSEGREPMDLDKVVDSRLSDGSDTSEQLGSALSDSNMDDIHKITTGSLDELKGAAIAPPSQSNPSVEWNGNPAVMPADSPEYPRARQELNNNHHSDIRGVDGAADKMQWNDSNSSESILGAPAIYNMNTEPFHAPINRTRQDNSQTGTLPQVQVNVDHYSNSDWNRLYPESQQQTSLYRTGFPLAVPQENHNLFYGANGGAQLQPYGGNTVQANIAVSTDYFGENLEHKPPWEPENSSLSNQFQRTVPSMAFVQQNYQQSVPNGMATHFHPTFHNQQAHGLGNFSVGTTMTNYPSSIASAHTFSPPLNHVIPATSGDAPVRNTTDISMVDADHSMNLIGEDLGMDAFSSNTHDAMLNDHASGSSITPPANLPVNNNAQPLPPSESIESLRIERRRLCGRIKTAQRKADRYPNSAAVKAMLSEMEKERAALDVKISAIESRRVKSRKTVTVTPATEDKPIDDKPPFLKREEAIDITLPSNFEGYPSDNRPPYTSMTPSQQQEFEGNFNYILCGLSEYKPPLLRSPPEHLDDYILPRFPHHGTFLELRQSVQSWGSVWGGVNNWNHSLDIIFERALAEGYKASHNVVVDVFHQSQRGKRFLAGLDELHGKLPSDNLAVALLWRYHDELVKILVKGVTILDCRLEYIERSLSDPDALSHFDYRTALGELTRTAD